MARDLNVFLGEVQIMKSCYCRSEVDRILSGFPMGRAVIVFQNITEEGHDNRVGMWRKEAIYSIKAMILENNIMYRSGPS